MELDPGDLIAERFEVIRELGQGGFARVYLARDLDLGRHVAIKMLGLRRASRLSPQELELFDTEAKATARLNHPNIVTVHDWGNWNGFPYLVLERLRGETLAHRLKEGPLPAREAIGIAAEVARALVHAHDAGILHLDLKPLNVFLGEEGSAKVLDFGMARLDLERGSLLFAMRHAPHSDKSGRGSRPVTGGTPHYMAPEQWRGEEPDARSDVWAVGVLLFETLTGKLPFEVTESGSTALDPAPAPSVRQEAPNLPAAVDRMVAKALAKAPAERFQSARELLDALVAVEGSMADAARRRRHAVLSAGVGVAAIAVVLAILFGRSGPPPRSAQPGHRQLTFVGDAKDAAISPDGKRLAYVSDRKLLVQDVEGGQPLAIFRGNVGFLRWAPDGSELMFSSWSADGVVTFAVPSLGGPPRELAGVLVLHAWSPDGTRIVSTRPAHKYLLLTNKSTGQHRSLPLKGSFTWLDDVDWSPAGDFVLFGTKDQMTSALWTIRTDGTDQRKVAEHPLKLVSPRWGPGGQAIYHLRRTKQINELWKVPFDPTTAKATGPPSALHAGAEDGPISLTRDGKRLVYRRGFWHTNIWLITIGGDGRVQTRRLTEGTQKISGLSVSPDWKQVAFSVGTPPTANLFTIPIDGGPRKQLTFLQSLNRGAVWSPDGDEIAFGSDEGGQNQVWRVSAGGGPVRPFTKTQLSESRLLAWAPGRAILYHWPGNRNFHLLDPVTEEERPLVRNEHVGWMFFPRYDPNGRRIAVNWNRKDGRGIWVISLDDGSQRLVRKLADGFRTASWSADGTALYLIETQKGGKVLLRVAVRGGEPKIVAVLPIEKPVQEEIVSPDGRRIICAVVESVSDVWMVEHFDPDLR